MEALIVENMTYLDPNTPPSLLVCMSSCKQSISTLFDYFYIGVGYCGAMPFAFDLFYNRVMKYEDKLRMDYEGMMDDIKKQWKW